MRSWVVLCLASLPWLLGASCDQVLGPGGSGGTTGASGASATATPTATAPSCPGFRDIRGECLDVSCLGDAPCDPTAPVPCYDGDRGDGVCFAQRCVYRDTQQGCGRPEDCPCGVCGADGRCYTDQAGGCGRCLSGPSKKGPCQACLASCQGTGPLCCAGTGCVCEGQCGEFM